jgi:hypothetical protein
MEARAAQPHPENLFRARHMLSEGAGELATGPLTPAPLPTREGFLPPLSPHPALRARFACPNCASPVERIAL